MSSRCRSSTMISASLKILCFAAVIQGYCGAPALNDEVFAPDLSDMETCGKVDLGNENLDWNVDDNGNVAAVAEKEMNPRIESNKALEETTKREEMAELKEVTKAGTKQNVEESEVKSVENNAAERTDEEVALKTRDLKATIEAAREQSKHFSEDIEVFKKHAGLGVQDMNFDISADLSKLQHEIDTVTEGH
nr:PREDICTED: uncharacterized protein LOC109031653 [Bemisia tabaci]